MQKSLSFIIKQNWKKVILNQQILVDIKLLN